MNIQSLSKTELTALIRQNQEAPDKALLSEALAVKRQHYGDRIFVRGLIEFTNYCKNNCLYCGIRGANANVHRYRLSKNEILACCETGYALGLHTFVLQGGEDPHFSDKVLADVVYSIKERYPDCAITLSVGERSRESYRILKEAGADRYLLRHETATCDHYAKLHPASMSLETRKACLYDLKDLGYQVGAGFMVGSPYQTAEMLAEDLLFLKELQPQMVGIGPFIPQKDTPFGAEPAGTLELTITMLALTRLLLPQVLLPATTALSTIVPNGREQGFLAGANVVMPNLSPEEVRADYALYDNKRHLGTEAAESIALLKTQIESAGFMMDLSRGDCIGFER